jgi:hypothetical protein
VEVADAPLGFALEVAEEFEVAGRQGEGFRETGFGSGSSLWLSGVRSQSRCTNAFGVFHVVPEADMKPLEGFFEPIY